MPGPLNEYEQHLFDLNCAAFGVGNWKQWIELPKTYTPEELEWLAHVRFKTTDLSFLNGVKIWPATIDMVHKGAQRIVRKRDPFHVPLL